MHMQTYVARCLCGWFLTITLSQRLLNQVYCGLWPMVSAYLVLEIAFYVRASVPTVYY